jgi:hypothetical protein
LGSGAGVGVVGRLQPAELVRGHLVAAEVNVHAWEGIEGGVEHLRRRRRGAGGVEAMGKG